jgi:hypothetical protein
MNRKSHPLMLLIVSVTVLALVAFPTSALANHSWGNYHWARTSNPFTVKMGDNVSGAWDSMLGIAAPTGVNRY